MAGINLTNFLAVAAIDFGTTYSGYAFSMMSDPHRIYMEKNWGAPYGYESYKTPTSVLVSANKECLDFGYTAENRYSNRDADEEQYHLFQHFKMILHKSDKLTKNTEIDSIDGIRMKAFDLFVMGLKYLKDDILKVLNQNRTSSTRGNDIEVLITDIRWVITVPAIWSDVAKRFMREAALAAGMIGDVDSSQLLIALEPESAALFCHILDAENFAIEASGGAQMKVGKKYLVVDIGGGTLDIAVHEVAGGGKVRELFYPTGGNWGGLRVNGRFENQLRKTLGDDVIDTMKAEHSDHWWKMMVEFEGKKRSFDGSSNLSMQADFMLAQVYKEKNYQSLDAAFRDKNGQVSFRTGIFTFKSEVVCEIYDGIIDAICSHLEDLLEKHSEVKDVEYMLLVGGFSESPYLQNRLIGKFGHQVKVLVPQDASLAVAKGAVLYGHDPSQVQSRISRRSYGIATNIPFDSSTHRSNKKTVVEGKEFCKDIFHPIITKGTPVEPGESKEHYFAPLKSGEKKVDFHFYAKDQFIYSGEPVYTDGAERISSASIPMPDTRKGTGRTIQVTSTFGGTEVEVKLMDITNSKQSQPIVNWLLFASDPRGGLEESFT